MRENPAARILIVDDDPASVQITARALKSTCRCEFALSGPQALERLAADGLPALILLDAMMPEMDGYTLYRTLHAKPRLKDIPVIFVTASEDPDSEAHALEVGAADFICKPINPPVLRLRVGLQLQLREREQALRDSEARLQRLAYYDALTGLPNRLLAAAAAPMPLGDILLQVSASLGVTFYPQPEEVNADQLLRQADRAMYQAKLAGKNRYHVFNVAKDHRTQGAHETPERIRRALVAREFLLYYQPKVNLRSGAVIGAEALIRWQHPQRGLLLPQAFLPAIEDDPLAIELGEWVVETALTQMEIWQAGALELPVSVNVGARQLQQADFVARLRALLAAHPGVKPSSLALEIEELSAMQDLDHVSQVVADCRELGVSCALDDFGIGYSSLTYLKQLAVTALKIDRSFVGDMLNNPDDLAIIESILGLANAFRLQTIAEGAETQEQGERLLQLGCEQAQGFGIAHPMPADAVTGWLADWRPAPH